MAAAPLAVAWARACDGLGRPRGTPLDAVEGSVLLKYLVVEEAAAPGAPPSTAPCRARRALRPWIEAGLQELSPALAPRAGAALQRALRGDRRYACRIVDLAVSDLVSEPMAPEVCIDPDPWCQLPGDGSTWTHGVVFGAAPLVTHELYPLVADACARDARRAGPLFRVVGVHGDWLVGGRASRVLVLDPGQDRFLEASLTAPLALQSAQLLALGELQGERHRCWAAMLDCPLVNPWLPAAAADDKHGLREGWRTAGLEVPLAERVAPGDRGAARRFLARVQEVVIKPNSGTEGERVLYLRADDADSGPLLDAHLAACWEWGPVAMEERRDGVAWLDAGGRRHSLALRLHVGRGPGGPRAESGYAQVGSDDGTPAARGRGGQILSLDGVRRALVRRVDGTPVPEDAVDLEAIAAIAEAAAAALPDLLLGGIDLVLDLGADGAVVPVLLELNPRPAGLAHARFLPGRGEGRCEAGVSLALWDGLAEALTASAVPSGL